MHVIGKVVLSFTPSITMAIGRYSDTRETPASPSLEEALSLPNETSPLLQTERDELQAGSRRSFFERCHSALSAFLDKNTGLLLVAASQFFFALSNLCVKWLNSLDERVPVLEVRG